MTHLERVRAVRQVALSPDGRRVAWVQEVHGGGSEIAVRTIGDARVERISASADGTSARERAIAWSPDSATLAFLSDAQSHGQLQLFVAKPGEVARRVTDAKGQLADPRWSPDGSRIALLYVEGSTQETGALVAYAPDAGVVGDVVEEQAIAVVDVSGGALRTVTPATLFVYDYDWSPDGKAFAAEAVEGSGTNNYWIAQLYLVSANTGDIRSLWKPPYQLGCPRFSPDGRSVAVIHGLMSDEGMTGGDVYLVPVGDGAPVNITPALAGSARAISWLADGRVLIDEYVDGQAAIATVARTGGPVQTLAAGAWHVSSLSASRTGDVVAAAVQSPTAAAEVYAGPVGRWAPQTSINAGITPKWGEVKSLHWASDEYTVQGLLMYPLNYDPAKRYPMVVSVHGGPSSAHWTGWPVRWNAVLPSQGYFVLLPNPRGSYGSGEAFTRGNIKDFGYGDLRDILAGIDAAAKVAPIDVDRVGMTGWSYGGYMTMWAITQTGRFRAAVAGAGIANWQSYYGQNRIDTWMLPFFGASVYENPMVYAKSSPITFIRSAKTPTLVLHGDRDSEVPTPQGYEFWHALKALKVPTSLVIYPEEGHAINKPEHARDIERKLVGWFDMFLR